MKNKFVIFSVVLVVLAGVFTVKAGVILPPEGVDEYRIIFTTANANDSINATSTDIEWYNTKVTEQADYSTQLQILTYENDLDWYCIGSTESVDARDNISPSIAWDAENIPIYNTHGQLVANNLADLFDGSIPENVNYDQWGDNMGTYSPNYEVWTGSDRYGAAHTGWAGDGGPLGTASVTMGNSAARDELWLEWAFDNPVEQHYLYGISSSIPEPSTIALLGMFALGLFFSRNKFYL